MAYARAQTIMLLSCKKVCFWLQAREKGRKEAAEWCLVSIRQVWNWCNKDTNISVSNLFNLMSTEQTPVFFAAPKYPAMLSKLAKGRTESYGDSARGPTWQSHEQRFPAALQ